MSLRALAACLALALSARAENEATVRAARPEADGQARTSIPLEPRRLESLHLGDLVASAPGALALDFGGVLATATVSLRGGTGDQAAILLDGVPLGSPAGGGVDLSTIPAALLDDVLLTRGSDARLGAGAMGGALELTPASGTRVLLTAGSLGTFGASASVSRDVPTIDALWKLTLAADVRRSQGDFVFHRDPTPEIEGNDPLVTMRRANNDAVLRSALVRAERLSESGRLAAFLFGTWTDRGLPGPIYSPTPSSRQDEKTLVAQLGWHTKTLDIPVFARLGRLDTLDGDELTLPGTQQFLDLGFRPAWSRPLASDVVLRANGLFGREAFEGTQHGNHTRLREGFGLEVAREKGFVTGSIAGRVEAWGSAVGWLPRAGASVRVQPGLFVSANVGAGFRPPSFGELYYASGPILPNPDLLPERSQSADLGVRFTRPSSLFELGASATAFGTLYDDVIVYELFSGSRAKPFNLGRARILGGEGEAHAMLREGRLAGLGLTASATLLDSTNLVAGPNSFGNALPYRPRARVSSRLEFQGDRVRASGGVDWTGEAYTNRANTRTVPAFADVRASFGVRVAGDVWLSAEVRNALDVTDRACLEGYPLPGRVVLAHLAWLPAESP